MNSEIEFIPVSTNDVEERMIVLRQQPVLLDCDVAALYGVKTKEINQAVRNNPINSHQDMFSCCVTMKKVRWSKFLTGLII